MKLTPCVSTGHDDAKNLTWPAIAKQNVYLPEQNFMLLKSTFDLFDRDGGGEIDTPEVLFGGIGVGVCVYVVGTQEPKSMFHHGLPFRSFALTVI